MFMIALVITAILNKYTFRYVTSRVLLPYFTDIRNYKNVSEIVWINTVCFVIAQYISIKSQ